MCGSVVDAHVRRLRLGEEKRRKKKEERKKREEEQ